MAQKPYTEYECASGNTGLGHSSLWTGAYPSNSRELCCCGEPLVEVTDDGYRYKVVFESISPIQAAAMQEQYGRGIWAKLTDAEWDALQWLPPITSDGKSPNTLRQQYKSLLQWAESHEQPIRNVHFYRTVASEQWEEQPQ